MTPDRTERQLLREAEEQPEIKPTNAISGFWGCLRSETRMVARWKLGQALAKVERLPGGRGKTSGDQKSFSNLLKDLDLDKSMAMDAQRIGCMPDEEMARLFEEARQEDWPENDGAGIPRPAHLAG